MIIHKLIDIPQKERRNDGDGAESDTYKVDVSVRLRKSNLPRPHYDFPRRHIARYAGKEFDFFEQRCAGEDNGLFDNRSVGDSEFERHRSANVVDCVGSEFGYEDVVVGRVADAAADYADGEGERGDGGDEVVGADYGGYD